MKILFITSNRLGDAVLSTGLLAWMVGENPNARFTVACGPYAAGLFRAMPQLERLIVMKKKSWNRHWIDLWLACAGTRWDVIVDLRNSAVTRLLRGDKKYYGGNHTGQHKVLEHADILELEEAPDPHVWLGAAADAEAAAIIPNSVPILALGPAANWACKQWPIENFIALAKGLTAPGGAMESGRVMVVADEKERAQVQPLLDAFPDAIPLFGKELTLVAACLKRARLFVGNDSGLMHLAAAMQTPTLGLFGPGYEDIYGPWGTHAAFVRTTESRDALLKKLEQSADKSICLMDSLSVERAATAARALLARFK